MKIKSGGSQLKLEISKERIINDLRTIGVKEGDHIAVTLSFKSIGHVEGGPEAFIDALLEVAGPNGTLMMNAFTLPRAGGDIPISKVHTSDYIFDHRSTATYTGLVPETLRKRKNVIRSLHPVCSVTAIGRLAKHLTEGHDQGANLYMPYSRLAEVNGKYLCIGLESNPLVAIRHEAQRLAGLFDVVFRFYGVKFRDDEGNVKMFIYNLPPCARKIRELVPVLRKTDIVKIGRIGMAYSILAPAKNLLEAISDMLKRNPTLNLCDKVYCLWCREAERKLDLYKKIENPKYFQKNLLIIKAIALINKFRLKKTQR